MTSTSFSERLRGRRLSLPKPGPHSGFVPKSDITKLQTQRSTAHHSFNTYIRQTFGLGKTNSELEFVEALEETGEFSFRLTVLFILVTLYLYIISVHVFTIGAASFVTVRCKIQALEKHLNFSQILNISLKRQKPEYQDLISTEYCKYDIRNYSELANKYNYNYDKIMDYIRNDEKVDPNQTTCENFMLQKEEHESQNKAILTSYSVKEDFGFFCENRIWDETFWLVWIYGAIISDLVGGAYADIFGRKSAFIILSLAHLIGSIFLAIPEKWCLLFGKFLIGFGSFAGISLYVRFLEVCSKTTWLWMGLFVWIQIPFATCTSYLLRRYIKHWRCIHLANTSMLLVLPLIIWYLPESPRWLLFVGNKKAAWKALKECESSEEPNIDDLNTGEYRSPSVMNLLKQVFQSIFRDRILICILLYFLQSIAMYVETKELTRDVQFHTEEFYLISTFLEVMFLTLACFLAIKYGRRETITLQYSLLSVINAIVFMVNHYLQNDAVLSLLLDSHLALSHATMRVMRFYMAELFPTPFRLTAIGLCYIAYDFGCAIQQHLYIAFYPRDSTVAYMPAFIAAVSCLLLVCFLPKTKNDGLPDVPREALYIKRNVY